MIFSFWMIKTERYQINRDIELAQIKQMLREQKLKNWSWLDDY